MKVKEKITSLPLSQQVALWVVLTMENAEKENFSFLSSQFAQKFERFVKEHLKASPEEYGKFVGAILSGLTRNRILVKLTGDRDKMWTPSDEVKENFEDFKNKLFEIKTYWS